MYRKEGGRELAIGGLPMDDTETQLFISLPYVRWELVPLLLIDLYGIKQGGVQSQVGEFSSSLLEKTLYDEVSHFRAWL